MIVLITNTALECAGGTQTVVLELCRGLRQRGHQVMVFSSRLGHVAELLAAEMFPVVSNLRDLPLKPDLIHGQHHLETISALLALPETPAIYYIHGVVPWQERVPLHPRILGYVNVSELGTFRLGAEKLIPASRCYALQNHVNLGLFPLPKPAPATLKTAVYCARATPLPETLQKVGKLCRDHSIELYVEHGWSKGTVVDPASVFAQYDLVFGNGRTALEAIAAGCVVSITDSSRLGPLITPANFQERRNFNLALSRWELETPPADLSRQLSAYDPAAQDALVDIVRSGCDFQHALDQLLEIYGKVLAEWQTAKRVPPEVEMAAASDYLRSLIPLFRSHESAQKHTQENVRLRAHIKHQEKQLAEGETSGAASAAKAFAKRSEKIRRVLTQFREDHPLRSHVARKLLRKLTTLLDQARLDCLGVPLRRPVFSRNWAVCILDFAVSTFQFAN